MGCFPTNNYWKSIGSTIIILLDIDPDFHDNKHKNFSPGIFTLWWDIGLDKFYLIILFEIISYTIHIPRKI